MRKSTLFATVLLAITTLQALTPIAFAHSAHDDGPPIPLTDWTFTSGLRLSAYLLKADDTRAWLVDAAEQTHVVPIAGLDLAGQRDARHAADRAKQLNARRVERAFLNRAAGGNEAGGPFEPILAPADANPANAPDATKAFAAFKRVKTHADANYLYIESDGLPDHPMMIGITAWQQQVPLPQPFTGENAWRIPLHPVVAKTPAMIKNRFLRGGIALAVNGVPIFNPQNNRGEISQEIGELDQWGGHCGRGDDYHYHITPMHLQGTVGKDMPVAYALDGYPIYGETEPDGSPVGALDECRGHTTVIGYHYHGANKNPYVMAGFHGEVVEREGQIDPQPRQQGVRPALQQMRGAKIVDFQTDTKGKRELTYEVNGRKGFVRYIANPGGGYTFSFEDPQGQKSEQTYQGGRVGGGGGGRGGQEPPDGPVPGRGNGNRRPPRNDDQRPPRDNSAADRPAPGGASGQPAGSPVADAPGNDQKALAGFVLTSPVVTDGGMLPREFTGDGESATPPIEWKGAPKETKSFAVVMHHIPGPGEVKWYWILYNLPPETKALPKNVKEIGTLGTNSVNGRNQYAPPHSKGPGAKAYFLTVYALSVPAPLTMPAGSIDRAALLKAIDGKILASAQMKVLYDRTDLVNKAGGEAGPDRQAQDRPGPGNGPPVGGDRPGPGAGPAPGGLRIIPRRAEESMNLSPEQRQKVDDLERETEEKLAKILTPEQMKTLKSSRPPGPLQGRE